MVQYRAKPRVDGRHEAGGMHLRAELQDFVSMNPQPKEVLDAFNEELEEDIRGFRSADPKNN